MPKLVLSLDITRVSPPSLLFDLPRGQKIKEVWIKSELMAPSLFPKLSLSIFFLKNGFNSWKCSLLFPSLSLFMQAQCLPFYTEYLLSLTHPPLDISISSSLKKCVFDLMVTWSERMTQKQYYYSTTKHTHGRGGGRIKTILIRGGGSIV